MPPVQFRRNVDKQSSCRQLLFEADACEEDTGSRELQHSMLTLSARQRESIEKERRILGAARELLLELGGTAFKNLIRYRDGGTMVLRAPAELVQNAAVSSVVSLVPVADSNPGKVVVPGDIVLIAVRVPGDGHRVYTVMAVVESLQHQFGIPCLTLRRLNGKQIEPGDSGGGVWSEGRLVANLWYRIKHRVRSAGADGELAETMRLADVSVAAVPPALQNATGSTVRGGESAE